MADVQQELEAFIKEWKEDPNNAKAAFTGYRDWLTKQSAVTLEFKARPGVSYSLRAVHAKQKDRPLFVLVDVVDDDSDARWLSVCFYADMVKDPQEMGDFVPQGLMGEDACCLNLEEDDADMRAYIQQRLKEACKAASK